MEGLGSTTGGPKEPKREAKGRPKLAKTYFPGLAFHIVFTVHKPHAGVPEELRKRFFWGGFSQTSLGRGPGRHFCGFLRFLVPFWVPLGSRLAPNSVFLRDLIVDCFFVYFGHWPAAEGPS